MDSRLSLGVFLTLSIAACGGREPAATPRDLTPDNSGRDNAIDGTASEDTCADAFRGTGEAVLALSYDYGPTAGIGDRSLWLLPTGDDLNRVVTMIVLGTEGDEASARPTCTVWHDQLSCTRTTDDPNGFKCGIHFNSYTESGDEYGNPVVVAKIVTDWGEDFEEATVYRYSAR